MEFTKFEMYSLLNRPGPLWLVKADFSEADLSVADLAGAVLMEANFTRADLTSSDLSGALLFGAILKGAILSGADLSEADLSQADLTGAYLADADLTEARVDDAKYSKETRWPDGFNPEDAGAILDTTSEEESPNIESDAHRYQYSLSSSSGRHRKEINYIETEDRLSAAGHGFEFHYRLTQIDAEKFRPDEPVAFLEPGGRWNNESKPIRVRIHPVSSPRLKDMGEKPEIIVAEVKVAIELFLRIRRPPMYGQLTEHIWIWVNA